MCISLRKNVHFFTYFLVYPHFLHIVNILSKKYLIKYKVMYTRSSSLGEKGDCVSIYGLLTHDILTHIKHSPLLFHLGLLVFHVIYHTGKLSSYFAHSAGFIGFPVYTCCSSVGLNNLTEMIRYYPHFVKIVLKKYDFLYIVPSLPSFFAQF